MLPVLFWYLLFCFLFCYDYQTGMRTEGSSDNNCHLNDLINGTVLGKAVPGRCPGGWRQALLRGQEGLTPGDWWVGVTPHPGNLGWFCGSGTCGGGPAPHKDFCDAHSYAKVYLLQNTVAFSREARPQGDPSPQHPWHSQEFHWWKTQHLTLTESLCIVTAQVHKASDSNDLLSFVSGVQWDSPSPGR